MAGDGAGSPLVGAEAVANGALSFRVSEPNLLRVIVNGAPRVMVRLPARSLLAAFTVANGGIVAIDVIADPGKFRGLPLD